MWIKDFLRNWSQQVVLKTSTFKTLRMSSGVPKGSVMGPVLFLLYINPLTMNATIVALVLKNKTT